MRFNGRADIILLAALVAANTQAADRYAAHNGQTPDPAGAYTSWANAASNIQDAVNAADVNETVWVGPGTYTLPPNATNYGGWNVVYINKPLTLRSSSSAPETTIIDGEATNRGIAVFYPQSTTDRFTIDGFTVRNGFATHTGGGILLDPNNTSWIGEVRNCIVSNNTVVWGTNSPMFEYYGGPGNASRGGGIAMHSFNSASQPIISNCTIVANEAVKGPGANDRGEGAGIWVRTPSGKPVITHCVIRSNTASFGGGYCDAGGSPTIANCEIRDNSAANGGEGCTWLPTAWCAIRWFTATRLLKVVVFWSNINRAAQLKTAPS